MGVRLVVLCGYLLPLLVAAALLFLVHLAVLGAALLVIEAATVISIRLVTRSGRRAGERAAAGGPVAPRPRLGTPLDPGMPSGRRPARGPARRRPPAG